MRLIPAHAGKTFAYYTGPHEVVAHPRSRGENRFIIQLLPASMGSSPLTRGKLRRAPGWRSPSGLIPAHAGKTWIAFDGAERSEAHPRSRGENLVIKAKNAQRVGSSPLTRGKPIAAGQEQLSGRLIPAHAGKTDNGQPRCYYARAHPRSRGENQVQVLKAHLGDGSSPLTRGKRAEAVKTLITGRLIPAHAGKTARPTSSGNLPGAHPRSRGENFTVTV